MKNLEQVYSYRKLQRYLISWFIKYLQNPQKFLFLKLISPTVFYKIKYGLGCCCMPVGVSSLVSGLEYGIWNGIMLLSKLLFL